jgi:hypothetical protein
MNHFSWKSLRFYGIAIGSVVTLFSIVTAYGEANLTAAPLISGDYLFTVKPSGCDSLSRLNLSLQQSGVYMNAALVNLARVPAERSIALRNKALQGRWQAQQLVLEGAVPAATFCTAQTQGSAMVTVKFEGRVEGSTLSGTLFLDTAPGLPMTAQRATESGTSKPSNTH